MPSNRLILCHPLLLLPSIFPSIRVFSKESALPIRWPKYCSFSFSISSSNEYSGLVSLALNDLISLFSKEFLSLFQHLNSKASIVQHSAFIMVQLSLPYKTTGKIIALTLQTFVGKMMTRFLICYLGLSLLFLQGANIFNFVAAVIICRYLKPKKIKSVTVSTFFLSICHEEMGPDPAIFIF